MTFNRCKWAGMAAILALQLLASFSVSAQTGNVPSRITREVNDAERVVLRGNTHPLARAEFDKGAAPDSMPMTRMLLLLQRSTEQQAALSQLMEEQLTVGSQNYHHWLTPQEFGQQFGPSDADVQAVTNWLTSQGFQVANVAAGRVAIEFSGTAGQVRQAFRTEIHKFVPKGEEHWANVSDPQIPAALAPVVAGIVSLHTFRKKPMVHRAGSFERSKDTGEVRPLFSGSDTSGPFFAVGAQDFAKIYGVLPLWTAGNDGSGQTIAIVGRSNINMNDVTAYRSLFGISGASGTFQVVLNGPDPGIFDPGEETEAILDTEVSGGVAKGAQILLVVSESTLTSGTDGVDLSVLYIVDNNLAPVMSESFSTCENSSTAGGNSFQNLVFEQAAAQGITASVGAGDHGSAECDGDSGNISATTGTTVNAVASTPFNVAVGGTDFDDATTQPNFWNPTNATGLLSAKGYIPEVPWNLSCAAAAKVGSLNTCTTARANGNDLVAGGGGPSAIYMKPSFQNGLTPVDGHRDLPDVSLFASVNSNSQSFYAICQADAVTANSCTGTGSFQFIGVGGTSAAAPAFAGIMAIINQVTGQRQGNANVVLYKLAAVPGASCNSTGQVSTPPSTCAFNDVTKGNISVVCTGGSPNCSSTTAGTFGVLVVDPTKPTTTAPAWTTGTGYDLATGLGTVNANNLAAQWPTITGGLTGTLTTVAPTTPPLPVPIAHGSSVSFTVIVTPAGATGDVSLIATGLPSGATLGLARQALVAGSSILSTNLLPGGSYQVTAHYAGDGTFAPSDATPPVTVHVAAEPSKTFMAIATPAGVATTVAYGSPYILRVDVTNSAAVSCSNNLPPTIPCPTGLVTLTDSIPNGGLSFPSANLNNTGFFEDQNIQLVGGVHNLTASYGGDSSYAASGAAQTVTVTKALTAMSVTAVPASIASGGMVTLTATVVTNSNGAAPGGTVQFLNGSTPIPGTVIITSKAATATTAATLTATLTTTLAIIGVPPPSARRAPPRSIPIPFVVLLCLAMAMLLTWTRGNRQRRAYAYAGLILCVALLAGLAGCGGGGSGGGGGGPHTDSISATYSGDANYANATAPAVPVAVQ
jgi:hypothetical protein